ncbi:MAG: hypothetical protein ACOCWQ_00350 [Nanoarchaeota archaeon]
MVENMRRVFSIIILICILAVAGCDSSQEVGPDTTPFVGGDTALVLSFIEAAPPDEVFDDGQFPFSVNVKVENVGEYDIDANDGYIELEGISADEFGIASGDLREDIPDIEGAKKGVGGFIIDGFSDVVDFGEFNYQADIAGTLTSIIRARACYNYETEATTTLCIKQETVDSVRENEVCRVAGNKPVENSGAPIQIKSITESPKSKEGIIVQITLGSVGAQSDSFYKESTDCDDRRNNPDRYVVYMEVDPIINGRIPAQCNGLSGGNSGYIKLFDGADRTIACSFDTAGIDNDFETRMNMRLRYRYSQFIEEDVIIRDVSRD